MTELLQLPADAAVLEIGADCGYQTAILAHIAREVRALERVPGLAERARQNLEGLGFTHVEIRCGDGFQGWPNDELRFDGILVACAPDHIPERLVDSLKPGARLVIPVGPAGGVQQLTIVTRNPDGTTRTETHSQVRFVPML